MGILSFIRNKPVCLVVIVPLVLTVVQSCGSSAPVVLDPDTYYYTNYYADGHLVSDSSGTVLEYFPFRNVFTNVYRIKNGNELWSEYGKVAKITKYSDGTIRIHSCVNENIRFAIGHTWRPE